MLLLDNRTRFKRRCSVCYRVLPAVDFSVSSSFLLHSDRQRPRRRRTLPGTRLQTALAVPRTSARPPAVPPSRRLPCRLRGSPGARRTQNHLRAEGEGPRGGVDSPWHRRRRHAAVCAISPARQERSC